MRAQKQPAFRVILIKPSKYDDDGYVVRHWRGVLPSNTLACLHGLTEDVRESAGWADVDLRVHAFDEAVEKLPLGKIAKLNRKGSKKVVVCLVGVQSNQSTARNPPRLGVLAGVASTDASVEAGCGYSFASIGSA